MEMDILAAFIDHFNNFVRKFVHPSKKTRLTLDGNSSRNGVEWLQRCVKHNIEVVKASTNTSHVLQPSGPLINNKFKDSIRETKSELDKMALINTKTIKLKLMLGVVARNSITGEDAKQSFRDCDLCPLDCNGAAQFKTEDDTGREQSMQYHEREKNGGVASRITSVMPGRATIKLSRRYITF